MSNYVTSIEKQNEELSKLLAEAERKNSYYKARIPTVYVVNIVIDRFKSQSKNLNAYNVRAAHKFVADEKHMEYFSVVKECGKKKVWAVYAEGSNFGGWELVFSTIIPKHHTVVKFNSKIEMLSKIKQYMKTKLAKDYQLYV